MPWNDVDSRFSISVTFKIVGIDEVSISTRPPTEFANVFPVCLTNNFVPVDGTEVVMTDQGPINVGLLNPSMKVLVRVRCLDLIGHGCADSSRICCMRHRDHLKLNKMV